MTLIEQGTRATVPQRAGHEAEGVAISPTRVADAGDLASYTRNARRSLRGAALGAALGSAAAAALLLAPSSYTAESTVRINPLTTAPFDGSRSASGLIDPATEAAVAQSDAVFELAVTRNGPLGVGPALLRKSVEVTPIDASTVLQIAVTADDPEDAQLRADAVAEAYLEHRAASAAGDQTSTVDSLEAALAAVDAERRAAGARFKASPRGSEARKQALADHRGIVAQRDSLRAQLEAMTDSNGVGGEVLTSAESVPPTVSPDRRLTIASGFTGGAVLGFLVAFLVGQLSTRVRRTDDLEKVHDLRYTGEVRSSRGGTPLRNVEAFRALREQRKVAGWPEPPRTTVLTLDLRRRPGLDASLGLAQALAQEHGSAMIVALGWEPGRYESRLEPLGFRKEAAGYVSDSDSRVVLRTFEADTSTDATDTYLTADARKALESTVATARPVVVWCPGSCGEATRLALLSRSDTVLLVTESKRSRVSDLRRTTAEAADAGVGWVGALIVR